MSVSYPMGYWASMLILQELLIQCPATRSGSRTSLPVQRPSDASFRCSTAVPSGMRPTDKGTYPSPRVDAQGYSWALKVSEGLDIRWESLYLMCAKQWGKGDDLACFGYQFSRRRARDALMTGAWSNDRCNMMLRCLFLPSKSRFAVQRNTS